MHHQAIKHLSKADKQMAKLIRRIGECTHKPETRRTPFQALVRSVAYQQLNGTAASTIFGRVKALYPGKRFPTAQDLLDTPVEKLRGAGLSGAKVAAIKDIAAKFLEKVVPDSRSIKKMSDQEIIERVTTIRGVGPWTAEMLLIFTLGRPDVLPATDYGVRKGFAVTYGLDELPKPEFLLKHGEIWRPHRSIAAWYLWRAADAA